MGNQYTEENPIPVLGKRKMELQKIVELGDIEKIEQTTEWCHPIVVVPKPNGTIRLCIDLTQLNTQIRREYRVMESVEDCLTKIGNAKYFTKLDANSGYWQVSLGKESEPMTTFITLFGRFCCLRAPFGVSSLPKYFTGRMDEIVDGCDGVVNSGQDLRNKHDLDHVAFFV